MILVMHSNRKGHVKQFSLPSTLDCPVCWFVWNDNSGSDTSLHRSSLDVTTVATPSRACRVEGNYTTESVARSVDIAKSVVERKSKTCSCSNLSYLRMRPLFDGHHSADHLFFVDGHLTGWKSIRGNEFWIDHHRHHRWRTDPCQTLS